MCLGAQVERRGQGIHRRAFAAVAETGQVIELLHLGTHLRVEVVILPEMDLVEARVLPGAVRDRLVHLPAEEAQVRQGRGQLQPRQDVPGGAQVEGGTETARTQRARIKVIEIEQFSHADRLGGLADGQVARLQAPVRGHIPLLPVEGHVKAVIAHVGVGQAHQGLDLAADAQRFPDRVRDAVGNLTVGARPQAEAGKRIGRAVVGPGLQETEDIIGYGAALDDVQGDADCLETILFVPETEIEEVHFRIQVLGIVFLEFAEELLRGDVFTEEAVQSPVTVRSEERADAQIGLGLHVDIAHTDTEIVLIRAEGRIHLMGIEAPVHEIASAESILRRGAQGGRQKASEDKKRSFHRAGQLREGPSRIKPSGILSTTSVSLMPSSSVGRWPSNPSPVRPEKTRRKP